MTVGECMSGLGCQWSQYAISVWNEWATHTFNNLSELEDYAANMKLDERRVINLLPFDAAGIDIILEDGRGDHA